MIGVRAAMVVGAFRVYSVPIRRKSTIAIAF